MNTNRFTLTAALLLFVALPMKAERVKPETARKAVTTFLNNNGAKSAQLTDLSKAAGFANLYIFDAEEGFVVMAADDRVQPILGYSLDGKFVADDMPDNVRGWLQRYSDEIQSAIDNQMKATSENAKMWKDLIDGNSKAGKATPVVSPLIQTKWDQDKYFNNLCPAVNDGSNGHAFTGCVATAMAQIMKYWNYPSRGIGSHSYNWNGQTLSANFGETTYDWEHMTLYYEYYYENGTDQNAQHVSAPTEAEINAVATLMYHCGISVNMNYGGDSAGGSQAFTTSVPEALVTYFNYKPTAQYKEKKDFTDEQWKDMVKAELNANPHRPLQYRGQSDDGGGHSFVCDGYDDHDYFHFNWGWAGSLNGYFTLSNLNTGANTQSGAGNGNYTNGQCAVFGIEPGSNIPAPTNLTYTTSGQNNVTFNWNGVNDAASYNVYCDGNLIDNTTATTYQASVAYGTHTFYIRCLDANGLLSLSSNTVYVTIPYPTPVVTDLTGTLSASGDEIVLSWTAPQWCYPEYPTATLTYGTGNFDRKSSNEYFAHRYLAGNLTQYANKGIYKTSFYANETGNYNCYIYEGTSTTTASDGQGVTETVYIPQTLKTSKSIAVTSQGWIDIDLDNLVTISGTNDIWVIMYYLDSANDKYPATQCNWTDSNNHGDYWGKWTMNDGTRGYVHNDEPSAWLIKTYVTDGAYTYNIYDSGEPLNGGSDIAATSVTISNLSDNDTHLYTVATNYYGGQTAASNMAGFTFGTASLNSLELGANDKMTLTENSKLTVSGTLSNNNAENLILENGAQLVHNTAGVKATVKKAITPYTANDNGWHLIASPVTEAITPTAENGFLNGDASANTYDLYYYDEPTFYWMNYESQAFGIEHNKGYLYANGEANGTTLQFAGTLAPSNNTVTISNLSHSATELKGFNLVGNPFACNASVNKDFYVTDGNTVALAETDHVIAPCEAIFVQASENNESVTFSKAATRGRTTANSFDIVLTQGRADLDRARVSLYGDETLEKFSFSGDNGSKIYIRQDGKDYAVASAEGLNELPLNFKATQNGTYTLSFELGNAEMEYLHLIDNLTGEDVNLLANANYTFDARTTDYPSRFRLIFNAEESASIDETTFAYVSNGEIHLVETQNFASLQIIDMTGRVVLSTNAKTVSTNGIPAGVYVLRLISGDEVKTQKIVIE